MKDEKKTVPELRPCPLCGGAAKAFYLAQYGLVVCQGCGLRLQKKGGIEKVAKKWNTRKGEKINAL